MSTSFCSGESTQVSAFCNEEVQAVWPQKTKSWSKGRILSKNLSVSFRAFWSLVRIWVSPGKTSLRAPLHVWSLWEGWSSRGESGHEYAFYIMPETSSSVLGCPQPDHGKGCDKMGSQCSLIHAPATLPHLTLLSTFFLPSSVSDTLNLCFSRQISFNPLKKWMMNCSAHNCHPDPRPREIIFTSGTDILVEHLLCTRRCAEHFTPHPVACS